MATKKETDQLKIMADQLAQLQPLTEIIPDVVNMVNERKQQEYFNHKVAAIARIFILICGAIGTFIATFLAVSKLIFTLGK